MTTPRFLNKPKKNKTKDGLVANFVGSSDDQSKETKKSMKNKQNMNLENSEDLNQLFNKHFSNVETKRVPKISVAFRLHPDDYEIFSNCRQEEGFKTDQKFCEQIFSFYLDCKKLKNSSLAN